MFGFTVLSNHWHIVLRVNTHEKYTDKDILQRYQEYYGEDICIPENLIPHLRCKLSNLSEFVKDLKQKFTRFYNKLHNRRGTLWGERFKSVLVENGETLINVIAYVDLNSVRAGLADRPEEYRWSGLAYHIQTDNKDNFLSTDFGLVEFGVLSPDERLRRYRRFVYEAGAVNRPDKGQAKVIDIKVLEKERKNDFKLNRLKKFRYKTKYFTESGIMGSQEYVRETFLRLKHLFYNDLDRYPVLVTGLEDIYSLKQLKE